MNFLIKINARSTFVFLFSLLILVFLNPFYVWIWPKGSIVLFLILSVVTSFYTNQIYCKNRAGFAFLVSLLSFFYLFANDASVAGALALVVPIMMLLSMSDKVVVAIFDRFKSIYVVLLLPGIFLWFVHHIFGFDVLYLGEIPSEYIKNKFKVDAGQGYALYPFAIVMDYMLSYSVYRFIGFLDEPGFVGTVSGLLIALKGFDKKSKRDYVIFLAGIISFSLAFYVIVFVYYAIRSMFKFRLFIFMLFFSGFFLMASSYNETVNKYLVSRVMVVDGAVQGDNRIRSGLDSSFNEWLYGDLEKFMFGLNDYSPDGSSSWKEIPVKSGFVGCILLILIFASIYYPRSSGGMVNVGFISFFAVFILSIYQRPYVVSPFFVLIFMNSLLGNSERR
ncbi:hypothetical protein [Aeromonas veronii]|uniref:hypothetical protein n=1 Tax=Aeromonas veronii TaxID=654 RepID=UPI00301D1C3A